ncbi:cytochrome P450 3A31 [Exophiala viscosa]|uniref:Cytochrome P450 3A31 n=1 Tax=Exophiala viscosa TaxID=2486360 RepID=A0AAN6IDF0_9EURO|nr:cytochrome P450 3A31 [Exophiala viscosa]KAI1626477.1 cytochrome P450 3A31 [Exophiala viscosa]
MGLIAYAAQSTLRVFVFLSVLSVLTLIAFCIRRIYFHPLSEYPGPLLAKVTDLYAAYHAWKGDIHVDMWRQHQRYGPYVRYAPSRLNIENTTALKDIYVGSKNFQKSPNYRVLRHGAANSLTMINKTEHARRRRIISLGLSDAAVRSHEPTIMAHIKKCFDCISDTDERSLGLEPPMSPISPTSGPREPWTPPRNMSNWFNWLTFDIMGDVVFGVRYNLLASARHRQIPEAIEQSNVRVSVLLQSPIIRQIGRLDRWLFPKAIGARNQFLTFVGGLVDQCMKPECTPIARTVVSILRSSHDPLTGDKLTAKELLAESTTLCVAGADTSSTALAAIFFYLSHTPRAYQRLKREVRDAFESEDEIQTGPTLNKLRYLRACIDEALRMSPPAGSSLFRQVQPGGAVVDGQSFPAGVEVGVPIYGIHHNAEYFPAPFEFRPERWLEGESGNTEESVQQARSAFCPFSMGTRGCVGKGMAMVELSLAVAYAVFMFDFQIADGDETLKGWGFKGEFPLEDHITGSKLGPMLRFKPRDVLNSPVRTRPKMQLPRVVTQLQPGFRPRSASSPAIDFSAMWKEMQ